MDDARARRDTAIVLGLERYILLAMGEQLHGDSGRVWCRDFVLAVDSYNSWFEAVRTDVAERIARMGQANS